MPTPARPARTRTAAHLAACLITLCGATLAEAQGTDRPVTSRGRAIDIDPRKDADDNTPAAVERRVLTPEGKPVGKPGMPGVRPMLVFTIDVRWLGATPYRIERDVTTPIERAVKTLPGVKEVHSSSTGSRAQTLVSFDAKEDASQVATALRNRLDQIKTRLPRGTSQPLIGWRREPPGTS